MSNNPKDTKVDPVKILEAIRRNNPTLIKGDVGMDTVSSKLPQHQEAGEKTLAVTMVNGIIDSK